MFKRRIWARQQATFKEWNTLPQQNVQNLIRNISTRIEVCSKARIGNTIIQNQNDLNIIDIFKTISFNLLFQEFIVYLNFYALVIKLL